MNKVVRAPLPLAAEEVGIVNILSANGFTTGYVLLLDHHINGVTFMCVCRSSISHLFFSSINATSCSSKSLLVYLTGISSARTSFFVDEIAKKPSASSNWSCLCRRSSKNATTMAGVV